MRHDELRAHILAYFKVQLAKYVDRFDADGQFSNLEREAIRTTLWLAEATFEDYWDITEPEGTDAYLRRFCEASGLPRTEAETRPDRILREIQKANRDMLRALEQHMSAQEKYDFSFTPASSINEIETDSKETPSICLSHAIEEYFNENRHAKAWGSSTFDKKEAALEVLTELLGADRRMNSISKQDTQAVKRLLLLLPSNRNKHPETRGLSLLQATTVQGVPKMTTVTVNSYISTFQSFYEWATKNGHAEANLFEGLRVSVGRKQSSEQRHAFTAEALTAVHRELTQNPLGLVKTESHKWAALIGIFSGARLNEICQMDLQDVRQEDGIWFFNLADEGENNKRLKSDAARRKVPIHAELIKLGFLDYHERQSNKNATRLFPDYSYCQKNGYGRALSRWFNETLTPALNIKSKAHVFHGLRHTMVTRLAQAGIEEPIYQSIVGHERKGVTQQVYMREGYTLSQLQTAINLFAVSGQNR